MCFFKVKVSFASSGLQDLTLLPAHLCIDSASKLKQSKSSLWEEIDMVNLDPAFLFITCKSTWGLMIIHCLVPNFVIYTQDNCVKDITITS